MTLRVGEVEQIAGDADQIEAKTLLD